MSSLKRRLCKLNGVFQNSVIIVAHDELSAMAVAHFLTRRKPLQEGRKDSHQARLVNKWQQNHGLPCEALAIEIQAKILWVEIDKR